MSSNSNNDKSLFTFSLKKGHHNEENPNKIIHSIHLNHLKSPTKNEYHIKLPIIKSHYYQKNKSNTKINKNFIKDILLSDNLNTPSNLKKQKLIINNTLTPIHLLKEKNINSYNTINLLNYKSLNKNIFKIKNKSIDLNDYQNLYSNSNYYQKDYDKIKNNLYYELNQIDKINIPKKIKRYKLSSKNLILNKIKNDDEDKNNKNIKLIDIYEYINDKEIEKKIVNKNFEVENNKQIEDEEEEEKITINEELILEEISDDNLNEYYKSNCFLVQEFAYKEEQNINYRNYMEDKGKYILNLNKNKNNALFCIFDGHGGSHISKYLQKNIYYEFKKMLIKNNNDINDFNFYELFQILDIKIKELPYSYHQGSTACIVYITKQNNKKILYCANVGDTRCILTNSEFVKRISYDHKAYDKNEKERIINEGGEINEGRIFGDLIISRAFGDWQYKNLGVISTPHIKRIELTNDDKYVIIASDGVWDVLDDLDVYCLSLKIDNSMELCSKIIETSLENGSRDNLSCFVIKL